MVKKARRKYFLSSLKNDFSRLLAIIIIVFLGVSFLIGLLQSGPDIQKTTNNYMNKQNLYDISLVHNNSINTNQKKEIEKIALSINSGSIVGGETTLEVDGKINDNSSFISLTYQENLNLNKLELVSGSLPSTNNLDECVVLTNNSNLESVKIGDKLSFDIFGNKISSTVVGMVNSPKYLSKKQIVSQRSSRIINVVAFFSAPLIKDIYTTIDIHIGIKQSYYNKKYIKEINQYIEVFKSKLDEINKDNNYIILDRSSNESISILTNDINKIIKVSNVFPLFFFIITVLVSSTSLSRIVTKDRFATGSLKSLGYNNKELVQKVLFYSVFASLIGITFGILVGTFLLPFVIHYLYQTLYTLPSLIFGFNIAIVLPICLISLLTIVILALIYESSLLKEVPAQLLLDKAPKPGKKILLERIKPIWKVLPFRIKSMFRNIFRFKKNLIMMLIGVGGSSALLLAGFGMSDSTRVLTDVQYKEIFHYDLITELNSNDSIEIFLDNNNLIYKDYLPIAFYTGNSINGNNKFSYQLIGSSSENLKNYITIDHNLNDESVIVSKQLLDECKIKINEKSKFIINGISYNLTVTGTTTNYAGNFVYIGDKVLNDNNIEINALIGNLNNYSEEAIDEISKDDNVKSLFVPKRQLKLYQNILSNLTYLILILIGLSGLLLITIEYNLVDINVTERKKELSTLKVLGYQKFELIMYIFREIFAMTIMGLAIGLLMGYLLHSFIISSLNSPGIVFGTTIYGLSYLYSIGATLIFSIIVTILLSRKINKIDMVGALKAND